MNGRLALGLLCWAIGAQAATEGRRAPTFTLIDTHGRQRSLAAERGHVVFVNFWASWCAPCQAELPELNRLAAEYKSKGVRVFVVNVDQDRSAGQALLAKLHLRQAAFDVLWDNRSKAVAAYDVDTMPTSFVIDRSGMIRAVHSGFRPSDPGAWRSEVEALLRR